jgi:hypothetical protein
MTATQMLLAGPTRADEIEAAARRAWREHPAFVEEIVRLAREDRRLDPTARLSIGELFVVARRNLRQVGVDVPVNHNWRRPWASWVMAACTDLDGAFNLRESKSEDRPPMGDDLNG